MVERRTPEAAATGSRRAVAEDAPGSSHVAASARKRKVSLTLDESLLEDLRRLAAGQPLSAIVNDLLARALPQHRLGQLADEMIAEAGEPPPEAYEHVLGQWFGDAEE